MNNFKKIQYYYNTSYDTHKEQTFPFDEVRTLFFLKSMKIDKKNKHLDIGCGVGFVCQILQERGCEIFGVDISNSAINLAEKRNPNGRFSLANPNSTLNFTDNYFNSITCLGVLEHILNPQKMVKESYRVLKCGGQAVFVVPNKYSPYFIFQKKGTGQIHEVPRSKKEWENMFLDARFSVEAIDKDPGPSLTDKSVFNILKLWINKFFSFVSINITYQFIFLLRKDDK